MSIHTEYVEIPLAQGGSMGGYLARPEGSDRLPGVVVFMEIFGINSHIRDVSERLAAEGYVTLAPDYFFRTGAGMELGYDDAGMSEGMSHLARLEADQMIGDARAAIDFLRARDDVSRGGIGAMGFCIGGHMTYLCACETDIRAAASFYGGGIAAPEGPGGAPSTLSRTPGIRGRIHCYFGGRDTFIASDQVDAIRAALGEAGIRHEVVCYEEAEHGFHCDQRESFDALASRDAWTRTLELFKQELTAES